MTGWFSFPSPKFLRATDQYIAMGLNALLILCSWALLVLLSGQTRDFSVLFFCGLGLAVCNMGRWWISRFGNSEETSLLRLAFYPISVLSLVFLSAFLVMPAMAVIVLLAATLGWFFPLVNKDHSKVRSSETISKSILDVSISENWDWVWKRFGFNPYHGELLTHHMLRRNLVIGDGSSTAIAFCVFLIWQSTAAFSALVILCLASITVWTHSRHLSLIFLSHRLPNSVSSSTKLSFETRQAHEIEQLKLHRIEWAPGRTFDADVFSGLCLMFIGSGGSGRNEILRNFITGQVGGEVSFEARSPSKYRTLSDCVSYLPENPVWVPLSLREFLGQNGSDVEEGYKLIGELDPFDDIFPEENALDVKRPNPTAAQVQIAFLARCLTSDAPILVLNSPESHMDVTARSALLALSLRSKLSGKILLVSTEDDMLMSLADEVVMLENRAILDRGPLIEVRSRHRSKFVRASFEPNRKDAFRLLLWLEALLPADAPSDLRERVTIAAEELLLMTPRDQFARSQSVTFDVKLGAHKCLVNMLDCGDVLGLDAYPAYGGTQGDLNSDFGPLARVRALSDQVSEGHMQGYRQITAVFHASRIPAENKAVA